MNYREVSKYDIWVPHSSVDEDLYLLAYDAVSVGKYRGDDKSLARTTSPCILFDCENISFDDSLVIYSKFSNLIRTLFTVSEG